MQTPLSISAALQEAGTRFLYPFSLDRRCAADAARAMLHALAQGQTVWEASEPQGMYREEMNDSVVEFLFREPDTPQESVSGGGIYLKIDADKANRWFGSLCVALRDGSAPISLTKPIQIELFLSDFGVGVLSLMMMPEVLPASPFDLTEFNYRVADLRPEWRKAAQIFRPTTAPEDLSGLSVMQRLGRKGCAFSMRELLVGTAPLDVSDLREASGFIQRVRSGGDALSSHLQNRFHGDRAALLESFIDTPAQRERLIHVLNRVLRGQETLPGLPSGPRLRGEARIAGRRRMLEEVYPDAFAPYRSDHLLSPLEPFGLSRVQDRLSVYAVARFDETIDFGLPDVRHAAAPFLSALANVEEPGHAGAPLDTPSVGDIVLNRCHWAGVGLLGAAHLVSDQPGNPGFNASRVPHMTHKYFVPYLAALIQRLTLQRLSAEAAELILDGTRDSRTGIVALRDHLLAFELSGYFTHVSSREAIHRWYRLCQGGLDVRTALDAVQRAFGEMDARSTDVQQMELQKTMRAHLGEVASGQAKLENLEVMIASVYGAELFHMLLPPQAEEHWYFKAPLVLAGAALGYAVGYFFLKRPSRAEKEATAAERLER